LVVSFNGASGKHLVEFEVSKDREELALDGDVDFELMGTDKAAGDKGEDQAEDPDVAG
jgi:hypothetical protein